MIFSVSLTLLIKGVSDTLMRLHSIMSFSQIIITRVDASGAHVYVSAS